MDLLSWDDVEHLLASPADKGGACLSLYMPTHRNGKETRENPIRFRNLLGTAEERLVEAGLRRPEARRILEPAHALENDHFFWQHQGHGLAVFGNAERFHCYRLPLKFDETVLVEDHFHVKPLFPMLQMDGRFYVLAVSQHGVRTFLATRQQIGECVVPDMPTDLPSALGLEYEKSLQYHAEQPRSFTHGGSETAMFHGHSDIDPKEDILQYFYAIDSALEKVLAGERVPLVFAGVDYLFPIFREACSYRYIADEFIPGSPDLLSADQLHQRAWKVVEPVFRKSEEQTRQEFMDRRRSGGASEELKDVLQAACYGRVAKLLVARDRQVWGTFNPDDGSLNLDEGPINGNEDLLDRAAVETLRHRGDVFVVDHDRVPGHGTVAAVYRYAI